MLARAEDAWKRAVEATNAAKAPETRENVITIP
jgi:hypothetical protein